MARRTQCAPPLANPRAKHANSAKLPIKRYPPLLSILAHAASVSAHNGGRRRRGGGGVALARGSRSKGDCSLTILFLPLQPPRPASTPPRLFPRRRSTSPPRSTRKPPSRWFRAPAQATSRPLRGRHPLSSQHSTPRRAATQPMLRLMQTTSWKASHWHRQQLQQQWRAAWRRAGGGRLSMPQQQAQLAAQRISIPSSKLKKSQRSRLLAYLQFRPQLC